jgi:hypothetical protein
LKSALRRTLILAAIVASAPAALAQSRFSGTWKIDISSIPVNRSNLVWVLQNGRYRCESCVPPIDVLADGKDQLTPRQQYDSISVQIVNDRTVREIEKKDGHIVSNELFVVSADGSTVTDRFDSWIVTSSRVAPGPQGAHALSGTWRTVKFESTSDRDLLISFTVRGHEITMSRPTGQSYTAKLDGTRAPYQGESGISAVSVRSINATSIEETDYLHGRAVRSARMTLSPDGKSMRISERDLQSGVVTHLIASKSVSR